MDKLDMPQTKESCVSCKVIAVLCLTGIGGYLIHTSRLYKRNTKIATQVLGAGLISLGLCEIFDVSPFRD